MRSVSFAGLTAAVLVAAFAMPHTARADAKEIKCQMTFSTSGWSVFYKTASGTGNVTCSNGQSMAVKIRVKGGGITFGKSTIKDGHGSFTHVYDIKDVLGHYAYSQAHAGASDSSAATVMTKGDVSLALSGLGKGWDLGVDFGAFIIEPAGH
jgi:hypothetical protein